MAKPALTVGITDLHRVEELRIPNRIEYFTQNLGLIAANRHWLAPHFLDADGNFDLVFQSWIFELDGRIVLVDPCTGNGKPHPVPFFDQLDVQFIERFEATGFRASDIDFVICTHLHHDHCGWNTVLRDGKWVPTFPKATYVFQQAEYDRWGKDRHLHPTFDYNDGVFERSVQPVIEAGLARLVAGDHALAPGLIVKQTAGHTVGHQMLHLTSAGKHALFTGDCFHHPIQLAEPSIPFGDAENPEQVTAIRRHLAELSADLGALLIPAHLQAPYAVEAVRIDGALAFRAAGAAPL